MNDVEIYKKMQKSPIFFIEKMWGLIPQLAQSDTFEKGKNITFQQYGILKAVEDAVSKQSKNRISVASGHGIGKSCVMAWLLLWYLFCYKDAQVPATAPTSDQMHDILWKEVAKWLDKMPKEIKNLYEWSNGYVRIKERPETWFARAKTARKENPEALAGVHADYVLYLIDEASGVPEEIFNVAEGALTGENVLVVMISNPTRTIGYFFDSHHKDKENWQTLQYSSTDSPIVDQEYIDRIISKNGVESDEYRIRVLGQFPKEDAIDDKGYVSLFVEKDINITDNEDFVGRKRFGIDPAGEGKDRTVWTIRDDFRAKVVATELISNAKGIAQKTLTLMDYWQISENEVYLDGFGVGSDVAIELAHSGKRIHSVNVGNKPDDEEKFTNLRAEAYWRLREWMKKGGELFRNNCWDECFTIRYRRELNGKMSIMPKKEMRKLGYKSPDHLDSLMLTFTREDVGVSTTDPIFDQYGTYYRD